MAGRYDRTEQLVNSQGTRIGSTIAGYRIESLLGRGGMSVVYLAEHLRLGRRVALKLLSPALSADGSFRERFERESRRAAEIDHPNIIPVYDAGEEDGQLFLTMKYVQGCDLKTMIARDGALGPGRALYLLEQVAGGLDAAHARDLVHRDVKPANVLVEEPSERVFVTDFGVVKHTQSTGVTQAGWFIGTADYAAPEQIEGGDVDRRADVYSLGCLLYECLTGQPPYARQGEMAVMHAHLTEPPPLLSSARPDLPRGLDRIVQTALAKQRDDRYATCGDLILAARSTLLQQHSSASPAASVAEAPTAATVVPDVDPQPVTHVPVAPAASEPPPAPPPDRPRRPRRGRGPIVAIAGLLLAAVLGGGVVFELAGGSDGKAKAQSTTDSTGTTESTGGAAASSSLSALMPALLWRGCVPEPGARDGIVASATCGRPDGQTGPWPDRWKATEYADARSLSGAFEKIRRKHGVRIDRGRCDRTLWSGDRPWIHADGKPGGRAMCFFENGDTVIVWTHEKLGQPTHRDFLGVARLTASDDHPTLYSWWRFWVHQIGKVRPA